MRILNPKFALATLVIAFMAWLAMTGKLSEIINVAKPSTPAAVK